MIRYAIKILLSVAFLGVMIKELKKSKFGSDIAITFFTFLCILAVIWYL